MRNQICYDPQMPMQRAEVFRELEAAGLVQGSGDYRDYEKAKSILGLKDRWLLEEQYRFLIDSVSEFVGV